MTYLAVVVQETPGVPSQSDFNKWGRIMQNPFTIYQRSIYGQISLVIWPETWLNQQKLSVDSVFGHRRGVLSAMGYIL